MSARPTSAASLWVPAFDGVRGLVTLSIAILHVQRAVDWTPDPEFFAALRSSAFYSIEFLFLLGGFVAFLPVAFYGRFSGVRSYALRRAGRILPLYYLTLVAALALGPALRPVSGSDFPHDVTAVLAHVAFLQQMVYPYEAGFGVQGIVWTMSIVAVFYVVFAVVARGYLRHPIVGLAGFVAVAVGWRLGVNGPNLFLQAPLFAADFGIGMSAALVYVRLSRDPAWRSRGRTALTVFVGALATLVALLYVSGLPVSRGESLIWDEGVVLSLLVPAAFAVLLISAPFMPQWAQWPLANRVARFVGEVGYGLFLAHFLVIWGVLALVDIPRDGSFASLAELTVLVIPLTLLFGWLGTRFVETPLRERAVRAAARTRRERGPVGAPGAPAAASASVE